MSRKSPIRRIKRGESGYAIVIVMFFLALLVLTAAKAAPTVLGEIQREREADMIWKGEQYARGVKLFYMKTHRFPPSLEDLTGNKTGIRFMRQAYKDPMNKVDGSWRLIYVGPNGQLIGSLKNRSLGITGPPVMPTNATGAKSTTSSFGNNSFGSSSFGTSANAAGGNTNAANAGQSTGSESTDANASDSSSGQPQSIAQPLGTMDASNVIGGNIIGVGSKVDKRSFRWYEKAKNYREFEFIWDPSKDLRVGGAMPGIGTPLQNLNGAPGLNAPGPPIQNPNLNGTQDPNANPPLTAPPSN